MDLEIGQTYVLSLEVENGTASVYISNVTTGNTDIAWVRNIKNSKGSMVFTYKRIDGYKFDTFGIYITTGTVLDNCKIKVQLERGTIAHDYQPTPISNVSLYSSIVTGVTNNLIPYPYTHTTKIENGITWTDNGDGTVTVNGTATDDTAFILSIFSVPAGTYTVSGSPKVTNCAVQLSASDNWTVASQAGVSRTITYEAENKFTYCRCLILKGTTVSNAVFKPQLERGTIAHDYSPYVAKETTVVNNNTTTESGFALDARQANPNVDGSMMAQISTLNSCLKNISVESESEIKLGDNLYSKFFTIKNYLVPGQWVTIATLDISMYKNVRVDFGSSYMVVSETYMCSIDSANGTGGMIRYNYKTGKLEAYSASNTELRPVIKVIYNK